VRRSRQQALDAPGAIRCHTDPAVWDATVVPTLALWDARTSARSVARYAVRDLRLSRTGRTDGWICIRDLRWWTPIASQGVHDVIDIASVRRIGPTFVTQTNSVPVLVHPAVVKWIDSASFIHWTCESMFSSAAHVSLLDALIRAETEIPMLMTWPHSAPAVICLDPASKVSERRWRPGSKRRSAMPASSWR